jgi:predicted adenylyl cyclase CyaB
MGLEIEAKMRVEDLKEIERRLKSAGAKPIVTRIEDNIFFDYPDGALRGADKGLRIRANRNLKTGRVEQVVTFKGPRRPGKLKSRPEFEFTVDNPKAAIAAFKGLGLVISVRFKKHRSSWMLGGCRVELDELKGIGHFVEIEGPGAEKIMRVRKLLGLDQHDLIRESYAAMVAASRK